MIIKRHKNEVRKIKRTRRVSELTPKIFFQEAFQLRVRKRVRLEFSGGPLGNQRFWFEMNTAGKANKRETNAVVNYGMQS